MPDFVFEWLKIVVYYLNLLLGNIAIVRFLKNFAGKAAKTPYLMYFLPAAVLTASGLVILLLVLTKFFKKENKGVVRVAKKR